MDNMKVEMEDVADAIMTVFPEDMNKENTIFVCIGTDRSTGDSLGPLVGTELEKNKFKVFGTVDEPVHAMNLQVTLNNLPEHKYIVAVDASLGQEKSVKKTMVFKGSISPGAGVGKSLPRVGHYSISPIVNVGGFMEYFVLQNTRLSIVIKLAEAVVNGLNKKFQSQTSLLVAASKE
jgi:putative sporulation protein YyaC